VPIPGGAATVTLHFAPNGWRGGLATAGAGLLIALAVVGWEVRRGRRIPAA
jgi:hypothetical protein